MRFNAQNFSLTLYVDQGVLAFANIRDKSHSAERVPQPDPFVVLGSLANINAALSRGVALTMPNDFVGNVTMTMISNDPGNTGVGGHAGRYGHASCCVFRHFNEPPINTLPRDFTTDRRTIDLNLQTGLLLSVADADAGDAANFKVQLSVDSGFLFITNEARDQFPT